MKIVTVFLCVTFVLVHGVPSHRRQNQYINELASRMFEAARAQDRREMTEVNNRILSTTLKYHMMNYDGSINTKVVKALLSVHIKDEAKLEKFTNICAQKGATPNETAMKLARCIFQSYQHRGDYVNHQRNHIDSTSNDGYFFI